MTVTEIKPNVLPPGIAKQIILFMLIVVLVTIILLAFEW